jgi:multiple sugar transport system ATP-binding protein
MNFLLVEVVGCPEGFELRREGFFIETNLPPVVEAIRNSNAGRLVLGIRPMHIGVCMDKGPGSIPAQVYVVEPLDEFNIVTALIQGERVLVEAPVDFVPDLDETIWLTFPQEKIHLFHPESERTLLPYGAVEGVAV